MRNSSDVFKSYPIPSVSETMNPEKLKDEKGKKAELRNDWGKNDFKAMIRRNMDERRS